MTDWTVWNDNTMVKDALTEEEARAYLREHQKPGDGLYAEDSEGNTIETADGEIIR